MFEKVLWATDGSASADRGLEQAKALAKAGGGSIVVVHCEEMTLPGKGGFNTAKSVLGSTVNEVIADFTTVDLHQLGQYDVVFFLGVLYHLREPFDALKRLAAITREVAIIETAALATPEFAPDRCLFEFFPGAELNGDPTNWWAPNLAGLIGACRAAGFSRMVPTVPEPETPGHYRITLQAWK